jgi:FAD/FMN-containing dehydrogenase
LPPDAAFMVLAEADGSAAEAARVREELLEALGEGALQIHAPTERREVEAAWRWRDGVSVAVTAARGGKVSEDIVVPVDRLAEAIEETLAIGRRHELAACAWGHAGDGNLHATFLVGRDDAEGLRRAGDAAHELFELAARLGGSISGEHGVGWAKRGELARQWPEAGLRLHEEIKRAFDPRGLMNPGKKAARR